MIHEAVRKEVRQYLSIMLPIVVKEVLDVKYDNKSLVESIDSEPVNRTTVARKLNSDILNTKDFSSLSSLLGNEKPARMTPITTPSEKIFAVTEHGTPVEVPLEKVPDDVVQALTKDYRPLMQALKNKKIGSN